MRSRSRKENILPLNGNGNRKSFPGFGGWCDEGNSRWQIAAARRVFRCDLAGSTLAEDAPALVRKEKKKRAAGT